MVITIGTSYEYLKQIRKAHQEYIKARNFVEDIVESFDRELRRESNKFDGMVAKIEGSHAKSDASYRKAETLEKKIETFEEQTGTLNQSYQAMSQTIAQNLTESTQDNATLHAGLIDLEAKLKDIETTQLDLRNSITAFEDKIQKLATAPISQEPRAEVIMPPIIIKRDKAMAALTETEIAVLEMLSKEGPKTAPEIKERVKLSREHTARLMKKLYEGGYLEREAGKIPFRYSLKKEMEALL